MEYRTLGRTDLRVSSIGIGCVTFGREIDESTTFDVLDRALEQGITLVDTAEVYAGGRSEEILGRWIAARNARGKIVLATKVAGALTRERVLASAETSLRRLKIDTIDLFQLHRWDPEVPLEETLGALHDLVVSGKVRYIGASNYAAWQLGKALWRQDVNGWARLESVQQSYSLVTREIESEMLPLCADQQVGMIAYSGLGAGFLTGKYRQNEPIPPGTRFDVVPGHHEPYFTTYGFRVMEWLRSKATELDLPMARLALWWVMGRPGVASVLVGARSPAHVDQALDGAALDLPDELRAEFDEVSQPH
jgi:aryl-alcohol dehydrogenase-like predicted oxidoreductase